jgi:hypothetical protein
VAELNVPAGRAAEIGDRRDGAGTLDAHRPLGRSMVWVNLPDFHAKIIDGGKT